MDVDLVVQVAACEFPGTVIDPAKRSVNVVPEGKKQKQRENEVDKSDNFHSVDKYGGKSVQIVHGKREGDVTSDFHSARHRVDNAQHVFVILIVESTYLVELGSEAKIVEISDHMGVFRIELCLCVYELPPFRIDHADGGLVGVCNQGQRVV